jgi:hypothetical protein
MTKDHVQLKGEVRYAIRLAERTAHFYRRIQAVSVFFSVLGGSAAVSAVADSFPKEFSLVGACVVAVFGAALIAIRPGDKAAQNETDVRRFQALMVRADNLDAKALSIAIEEARLGSAQEIESLRDVAYNDVVMEFNRPDALIPLTPLQKILSALA